ncbi:hypothetical protein JKY72_05150 [Candidatus Gracilibacteria bacterium]|nr:hypothetical protein [Candidatus Gracilibacteria bacterium]
MRLHRSLVKAIRKIDPSKVADQGENYLEGLRLYKNDIDGIRGVATAKRIKPLIKKIDQLEREILRQEQKLEDTITKRKIAASKLRDEMDYSLSLLSEYLEKDELADFQ